MQQEIIVIIDNIPFYYDSIDNVVNAIIEEYHKQDVSIIDLLENIEINGLSINDVVKVYARLHHIADGDQVVRYIGEHIDFDDQYLDLRC